MAVAMTMAVIQIGFNDDGNYDSYGGNSDGSGRNSDGSGGNSDGSGGNSDGSGVVVLMLMMM